jgi:hypothetical protein
MTEFKGDKRTKEYKAWKAKYEKESKGVGDSIEKITTATGIKKAVKWIAGEDCGCDERKVVLNRIFPYEKPECLTEEEYNFLSDWFSERRNNVSSTQQKALLNIYNRVFKQNAKSTSCGKCFLNGVLKKLEKIYLKHK